MSSRLFTILTFILVGRPQDYFSFLVPFRLALVFTLLTIVFTLLENKDFSVKKIFEASESKKYVLFYCIMIFGIPFAYHRRFAFEYIFLSYAANILYFFLFYFHIDSLQKLRKILFTITASVFFYGMASLILGNALGGRLSFGGMYDPNDLAYLFVTLFPLAFNFISKGEIFAKRMLAAITLIISPMLILMTGSRGGVLALFMVSMLLVFTKMGSIKKSLKIAAVIGVIIMMAFYSDKIDTERFKSLISIAEIKSDYNVTGYSGRLEIWKTGLKLIKSHPFTGVGVNCFSMAFGFTRDAEGRIPIWKAAHNSFILIAAEMGVPGFIVFMSLVIGCIKTFSLIRKTDATNSDIEELQAVTGLIQIGFIGHFIAAFFLTHGYSILFTLFFVLSATLRRILPTLQSTSEI